MYKKTSVPNTIIDYLKSNVFWLRLMIKSSFWAGIAFIIIQVIMQFCPLISVWIWKLIVDMLENIFVTKRNDLTIWILLGSYLTIQLIESLISSLSVSIEDVIYRKTRYSLNKTIIEKMSSLDASFFSDPKNADLIDAAESSEVYLAKCIPSEVITIIGAITFIVELVTFLAYFPFGGFLFLLTYIPGAIYSYSYKKKMDQYSISKIPENRKRNYYKGILTTDTYAKDLRLYNLKSYILEKYNELRAKIRKERKEMFRKNTIVTFLLSLLTYSSLVVVIFLSVISVIQGNMTIGMLTLYIGLAQTVGAKFQGLLSSLAFTIHSNSIQYNRYIKFVNYKDVIEEFATSKIDTCPSIEFKDVYFKYPGSDSYALEGVSFRIDSGEKVAIVGINGAGKTTIIKLLLRFYSTTSGQILINDKNILEYSIKELYNLFSVCFQDVNVYSMTIKENIAISNIDMINDDAAIHSAAFESGLNEIIEQLPNGYEANMNRDFYDDGITFSGGQKQKLAITRAYFKNSKFIILDEPSSALDPVAEDKIFSSFKKVCKNKGGILISHRLSSIMMVDKIILIDSGKVIESGTHKQLIEMNKKYAEMYKIQSEKYKI